MIRSILFWSFRSSCLKAQIFSEMIGKIYFKSLIPKHSSTSSTIIIGKDYLMEGLWDWF